MIEGGHKGYRGIKENTEDRRRNIGDGMKAKENMREKVGGVKGYR